MRTASRFDWYCGSNNTVGPWFSACLVEVKVYTYEGNTRQTMPTILSQLPECLGEFLGGLVRRLWVPSLLWSFCVEFSCSPFVCVASLQLRQLTPTVQKHPPLDHLSQLSNYKNGQLLYLRASLKCQHNLCKDNVRELLKGTSSAKLKNFLSIIVHYAARVHRSLEESGYK